MPHRYLQRNAEVRSVLSPCGSIALPGGARRDEGIKQWKLLTSSLGAGYCILISSYNPNLTLEPSSTPRRYYVLLSGSTGQQTPPTLVPCASTRSIRFQYLGHRLKMMR
ncbi:hypothetical protein B0H13DRAFT_1855075 [Mycena leptocephala]|nr:hypothetical protein B0H13DRAFT_1855075 [Mycena leptocephala]